MMTTSLPLPPTFLAMLENYKDSNENMDDIADTILTKYFDLIPTILNNLKDNPSIHSKIFESLLRKTISLAETKPRLTSGLLDKLLKSSRGHKKLRERAFRQTIDILPALEN